MNKYNIQLLYITRLGAIEEDTNLQGYQAFGVSKVTFRSALYFEWIFSICDLQLLEAQPPTALHL